MSPIDLPPRLLEDYTIQGPDFLTVAQAATLLSLCKLSIKRRIKAGIISSVRVNSRGDHRIHKKSIESYIQSCMKGGELYQ